jgi:hypothetical protein
MQCDLNYDEGRCDVSVFSFVSLCVITNACLSMYFRTTDLGFTLALLDRTNGHSGFEA